MAEALPRTVDRDAANDGGSAWRKEAAAQATAAASERLLIEQLDVGPLRLLVDVHLSGSGGGAARLPVTVDTSR